MRAGSNIDVAFIFGPFKLIPSQQLLVREGQPVKVGGRALDILHLLLLQKGQVVDKDALITFAWPNVYVDESNLKVHISSLRRALEDTLPQTTYIATVAGRGYQFVGQVQTAPVGIADVPSQEQPVVSGLPLPARLIGRQRDLRGIVRSLDFTRFVTLVGPGGVGKTSLAIAVAHASQSKFPDGLYFVNLSATTTSALVPHLLAVALGFRSNPADIIATLVDYLKDKRILIILDNCEHVLHAAAALAAQLTQARISSSLLATSREPLSVSGENVQRVEPLAFPPPMKTANASKVLAYPAVELFALRAFETADYRLADEDSSAVARLCEALDGLPLAIEIAAAKLVHFSAAGLLESVTRHLSELRNDDTEAHSRHRTLWATLDWSYQLLAAQEATLFRLLSVFTSLFEWSDVASMSRLAMFEPYQTTVALGALVSKSLLAVELDGEQLRYRFFESTKSYAAERLQQDVLARAAHTRHAHIVLSLFRQSELEWATADNRVWRARYEVRIGDLRSALDWCFSDDGDTLLGIDLAVAATRFWDEESSVFEQLFQVERALGHCRSLHHASQQRAALATSRAWIMTYARRLHSETDHAWKVALSVSGHTGEARQHLSALLGYAHFLNWTGSYEHAMGILDTFAALAEAGGDRGALRDGDRLRALVEIHLGKLMDAEARIERLLSDFSDGVPLSMFVRYQLQQYVHVHGGLAFARWLTGEPERALLAVEEMISRTEQGSQLIAQSLVIVHVALPLVFLGRDIDALDRYAMILRGNLNRENIASLEPLHSFYSAASRFLRGDASALENMRSVVEADIRDRFFMRAPMHLAMVADALLTVGKAHDADEVTEQALALHRETKESWCFPELLRVKARIISSFGDPVGGCDMLLKAREHAVEIGARSLELRIVNDIAEVLIAEGHGEEAAGLLDPLYRSFENRTVTGDLRKSGVLLAAASAARNRNDLRPTAYLRVQTP